MPVTFLLLFPSLAHFRSLDLRRRLHGLFWRFYSSYEETSLPGDFDPNNNFITSELCVSDTGVSAWVGERARRLRTARQA